MDKHKDLFKIHLPNSVGRNTVDIKGSEASQRMALKLPHSKHLTRKDFKIISFAG